MPIGNPTERIQMLNRALRYMFRLVGPAIALLVALGLGAGSKRALGGETSLTEYQVKSLFLMNFAKYVDWPPVSFAGPDTPIVIGLYGEDKFGTALRTAVAGKIIGGRRVVIQSIGADTAAEECHILFISDADKGHMGAILNRVRALPVLTVGETDQFLEQGGVINFVKKDGKVRLEINLAAARQAKLEISSKLLKVADVVRGKVN